METSTDRKLVKRPNVFVRMWRGVLRRLSYVGVAMFESHMIVVVPCERGIMISGAALSGASGVTVNVDNFNALERQLASHDPEVPFPFKQGSSWACVPPRFFRLLSREVRDAIAAWRSLR